MKQYFKSKEVILIAGISYRQLDYWISEGVVSSTISSKGGRGSVRRFDYSDLVLIKMIGELIKQGLNFSTIKRSIGILRKDIKKEVQNPSLTSIKIVTDGDKMYRISRDLGILESIEPNAQFAFSFGLSINNIVADISKLSAEETETGVSHEPHKTA